MQPGGWGEVLEDAEPDVGGDGAVFVVMLTRGKGDDVSDLI